MRRSDREILDKNEINSILNKAIVGHLALSDSDQPYVIALNFGVEFGDTLEIYFHSAPVGKKINIIKKNNKACFQVESDLEMISGLKACKWGMNFKSVIMFGSIELIEEPELKQHGMDLIMSHYSDAGGFEYDEKVFLNTTILRLTVDEITAKQKKI
jgi:uncharacterized protein